MIPAARSWDEHQITEVERSAPGQGSEYDVDSSCDPDILDANAGLIPRTNNLLDVDCSSTSGVVLDGLNRRREGFLFYEKE